MKPIQLIILWLSASECWTKIFEVSSKFSESSSLVDATVKILSSCYDNKVSTVGLAGSSDIILYKTLCFKQFLPLALIGNATSDIPVDRKSRQKLQLFVVVASSSTQLNHTLGQIKLSRWWNHMATFIIIDWTSKTADGCSKAFTYLWTAWNRNLLNALYVCQNQTEERLIYSFNPYTNKAPKPWHPEKTFKGKNDHPWTLLRRDYGGVEKICVNLKFDKTIDLGGYKIYSSVKEDPPFLVIDHKKKGVNSLSGTDGILPMMIFQALNATTHLIVHDRKIPGSLDKYGNDMAMETVNGISDILIIIRFNLAVRNYTVSRVFAESALGLLTQRSGEQSQLEKLISVFDRATRYGLLVVMLITVIFFKFCLRQQIGTAILNVFRLVGNTGLTRVPNNQAARLYLAGVLILVVTIIGIYQGKWASLLTKPAAMPNIESMQDLADRGYTIHGTKAYAHFFDDPIFKGRYIKQEDYECKQHVSQNPLAACVGRTATIVIAAAKLKLHISRDSVTKIQAVYVIRDDWPLEERFNSILAALVENNVIGRLVDDDTLETLKIARFYDDEDNKEKFQVIVLNELIFAFVFLGIGLGFATVCFAVEIAVEKLRKQYQD